MKGGWPERVGFNMILELSSSSSEFSLTSTLEEGSC